MRIWSLHPSYLDSKGLVALWRETLLAKHVLEGKTKGYTNHPQLDRFKAAKKPLDCINHYLAEVYKEAVVRGYQFDRSKINWKFTPQKMTVTSGQVAYESELLLRKLYKRDRKKYASVKALDKFKVHALFKVVRGPIESWEIVS